MYKEDKISLPRLSSKRTQAIYLQKLLRDQLTIVSKLNIELIFVKLQSLHVSEIWFLCRTDDLSDSQSDICFHYINEPFTLYVTGSSEK